MRVSVFDPDGFASRFFSVLGDSEEDVRAGLGSSFLDPLGTVPSGGPPLLYEFVGSSVPVGWHHRDHGGFSSLTGAPRCPAEEGALAAALRRGFVRACWRAVSPRTLDAALGWEGWPERVRPELDAAGDCFYCPKPPCVAEVLSSRRYSPGTRSVVALWWAALCDAHAGDHFGLSSRLASFLKCPVEVDAPHFFFGLLRGGCIHPPHRTKPGAPVCGADESRVRVRGSSAWTEKWPDRVVWAATAFFLSRHHLHAGLVPGGFREAYVRWMDGGGGG